MMGARPEGPVTAPVLVPCSAESWRDPFPMYRALRDRDPVHRVAREDAADGDGRDYWVLSRFQDVHAAAVDAATFSSAQGLTPAADEKAQLGIESPIVMMDPPEHTALRKLAIKRFTPRQAAALEPMVRDFVRERVERLRERGADDVVAELLKPLPSLVVAHFLGVPAEDRAHFDRWTQAVVAANAQGEVRAASDAVGEMAVYFAGLIERRRTDPGEDVISALVHGRLGSGESVSVDTSCAATRAFPSRPTGSRRSAPGREEASGLARRTPPSPAVVSTDERAGGAARPGEETEGSDAGGSDRRDPALSGEEHGGERLEETALADGGLPGDRAWAVRDEMRGGIRGAKKIPALMGLRARYTEPPRASGSGPAEITLPDGTTLGTGDPDVNERLSKALGHDVSLWPLLPADALDHYRRGAPSHDDLEQELRAIFGRAPDEPLPDLSVFPPELLEFESPPGTYFDAFPLLLLSRASLTSMRERAPDSVFDERRFRPNLLVAQTDPSVPFPETLWAGRRLRVGEAVLRATVACPRCVMTTHGFEDLPRDPTVMRALVREAGGNLGLYAAVESPGRVRVGDALELLD